VACRPALGQVRVSKYQHYEFLALDKPLTENSALNCGSCRAARRSPPPGSL